MFETKDEIIKFLADSKYTRFVALTEGKYDMIVWFYLADQEIFINFYDKFLRNYRKYLAKQFLTGDLGVEFFSYDFLLSDKPRKTLHIKSKKSDTKYIPLEKFDNQDILILKELAKNPRIQIIEIAKKIGNSAITIKSRIQKLIDKKIIFGFSG